MKPFWDYMEVINEAKGSNSSWERWKENFKISEAKNKNFLWINSSSDKNDMWYAEGESAKKIFGASGIWSSSYGKDKEELGLGWKLGKTDFLKEAQEQASSSKRNIVQFKVEKNDGKKATVKVFYDTVAELIDAVEA